MRARWDDEKQAIGHVREIRERIEVVRQEMERAERAYELEKVAELRHGTLPEQATRQRLAHLHVALEQADALLHRTTAEFIALRARRAHARTPPPGRHARTRRGTGRGRLRRPAAHRLHDRVKHRPVR